MSVTRCCAQVGDHGLARAIAGALQELITPAPDALTLFEDGPTQWRIEAYFNDVPDLGSLHGKLSELLGREIPEFQIEEVPDKNWVALSQAALPPVHAGRFVVHGSHDRHRIARGPNSIEVEAGEAFGTAHHATTYGCLCMIDRLARSRGFLEILDLGCGSGVLAIAATRVFRRADITASDIDATSIAVSRANIRHNGAQARVRTIVAKGFGHPQLRRRFDLVIANILAGPLILLACDMARACRTGGMLVLSGILNDQVAQVIAAYRATGFIVFERHAIDGWTTLVLRRVSAHS